MKSYVKTKGYDFEEVSARTAEKVEAAIKNFGKKIAEKKYRKLPPTISTNGNPGSGSTTTSYESARNAGVSLQNSASNGSGTDKKKEGCC